MSIIGRPVNPREENDFFLVMNEEARDFLNKLDYPFDRSPTLVLLRTPSEYRSLVDHLSRELTIDAQQLQAGDEFLVAFVRTADEINRTITRYAHRIGENGKFWFVSNRLPLLADDNLFLSLTNAQFESNTSLVRLKYDYQAKLFQLKDQISKIVVDLTCPNTERIELDGVLGECGALSYTSTASWTSA